MYTKLWFMFAKLSKEDITDPSLLLRASKQKMSSSHLRSDIAHVLDGLRLNQVLLDVLDPLHARELVPHQQSASVTMGIVRKIGRFVGKCFADFLTVTKCKKHTKMLLPKFGFTVIRIWTPIHKEFGQNTFLFIILFMCICDTFF